MGKKHAKTAKIGIQCEINKALKTFGMEKKSHVKTSSLKTTVKEGSLLLRACTLGDKCLQAIHMGEHVLTARPLLDKLAKHLTCLQEI